MLMKTNRMAQEVKVPATKPDSQTWIPGTHMVEEKKLPEVVL